MTHKIASRADWSKHVESTALVHPDAIVSQAISNFRNLRDAGYQLKLAQEIAETRGPELTLAYRNVIMVGAGFRSRTLNNGKQRVSRSPCVIFVVRRKLTPKAFARNTAQLLPKYLLTYGSVGRERQLFAVPTDVQPEVWFHGAKERGPTVLRVEERGANGLSDNGSAACAVLVELGGANRKYLMSALHVFSPTPDVDNGSLAFGASISLLATSNAIAKSTSFGGQLILGSEPSFDVQLAEITDAAAVSDFLSGVSLSTVEPYITEAGKLAELGQSAFEVRVPVNNPNWPSGNGKRPTMFARFNMLMPTAFALNYAVRTGGNVHIELLNFWQLIRLEILGSNIVVPGDSGSALMSKRTDGTYTLIGMLTASKDGFAYAIPAWQLFNPVYYQNPPSNGAIPPIIP